MNPKASLKSLNVKVRAIASRPATSLHPGNPFEGRFPRFRRQPFRHDNLPFHINSILTPDGAAGIPATIRRLEPVNAPPVTMTQM